MMSLQNKAVREAGEGGTPADVTTPGLVEWESVLSTATSKDGKWVPKVFPDRPNYIHIQRKELSFAPESIVPDEQRARESGSKSGAGAQR